MIEWISSWAQQVIVAIVIATLIEMILPNGNSKKYIKTVIGVYVLFTILSPIVSKVIGGDISLANFDYENYLKQDEIYNSMSNTVSNSMDNNIEETYITSLKQDIKTKLKLKGFQAEEIVMNVNLQEGEKYGTINTITLHVTKIHETEEEANNSINHVNINQIEISNTEQNKKKPNNITQSEEREIKQYIEEEYGVKKDNITVN